MDRKRKRLILICLVVFVAVLAVEAVVIAGVNGWLPGSGRGKQKTESDVGTAGNVGNSAEGTDGQGGNSAGKPDSEQPGNSDGGGDSAEGQGEKSDGTGELTGNQKEDSAGNPGGDVADNPDGGGDSTGGQNENSDGTGELTGSQSGNSAGDSGVRKLKFRMGSLTEGDVPEEAFDQITRINSGEPLADVVALEGLEGYFALTGTNTVIAEDKETGDPAVGEGSLTLHVPNLLASLEDISVLFYDNAAGEWKLIPAKKTDAEAKTVSVTLTGSGTLAVVYRRQAE